MTKNNELLVQPRTAAILMTYQCTAACDECCFSCSPHLTGTALTYEKIKSFLDQVSEIPSIKIVVFSGGECFLDFELLKQCIQYATQLGLLTRCVSNGFWAKNLEQARQKMHSLKSVGLHEMNFSTGDSHQQFVPVDSVLNGTIASVEESLYTCIAVETNSSKKFTAEDFKKHPLYLEYLASTSKEKFVKVMPATWVSFHTDNVYDFNQKIEYDPNDQGCEGMFDTISLEARGDVVGCCGITSNDIEEFHLGKLSNQNLDEMHENHQNDFLKIWIFVDGPKKVMEQVAEWTKEEVSFYAHKCLYCAALYNNPSFLKAIQENYLTVKEDVLSRFLSKSVVFNMAGA